jgi:hypothetical protein
VLRSESDSGRTGPPYPPHRGGRPRLKKKHPSPGVYLEKGMFRARFRHKGKTLHLGYYQTESEAAAIVAQYRKRLAS